MADVADVAVVHRDPWFLVLNKPSGIATTRPAHGDTLVDAARALDPKAPRLHPSSRLDAEASGLVTFARTKEATEHLLRARQRHAYTRQYLALTARAPVAPEGVWEGAIAIDPRDPRKRMVASRDAKAAASRYQVLAERPLCALLWLSPETGRTHQLRVHASHAGVALLGDRPYGGPTRVVQPDGSVLTIRRAMLHCTRVSFPNPDGGSPLCFEALPPSDFMTLYAALDGGTIELP